MCGKNQAEIMAIGAPLSLECDQLSVHKEHEKLVPVQRRLLAAAQLMGPQPERAAWAGLCNALLALGDYRAALPCATRQLALAESLGDGRLVLKARQNQMVAWCYLGNETEALACAETILSQLRATRGLSPPIIQAAKHAVSVTFGRFAHLRPELAERSYRLTDDGCELGRSSCEEAYSMCNMANGAAQTGNLDEAEKLFKQSVKVHPTAIAYKGLADVAGSHGDLAERSRMLRKAAKLAKTENPDNQLGHRVVVLSAWHNDLSANGKHKEASEVRPLLSGLLKRQSTTAGFEEQCIVCLDDFGEEGCWVVQGCRHLVHSECLKQCVRADRDGLGCPICRQPMNPSDVVRLFGRRDWD